MDVLHCDVFCQGMAQVQGAWHILQDYYIYIYVHISICVLYIYIYILYIYIYIYLLKSPKTYQTMILIFPLEGFCFFFLGGGGGVGVPKSNSKRSSTASRVPSGSLPCAMASSCPAVAGAANLGDEMNPKRVYGSCTLIGIIVV